MVIGGSIEKRDETVLSFFTTSPPDCATSCADAANSGSAAAITMVRSEVFILAVLLMRVGNGRANRVSRDGACGAADSWGSDCSSCAHSTIGHPALLSGNEGMVRWPKPDNSVGVHRPHLREFP